MFHIRFCLFLVLVQIKWIYYMLQITSYHNYLLVIFKKFQHDLLMMYEHVCLIRLYVDMLTLFKRLLAKK
jgi:hypothetical protein